MPLSEHEQRLLDQIERALYAEDPKLASAVRASDPRTRARRRLWQSLVLFVIGIALLFAGVIVNVQPTNTLIGLVGFLVMFGSAILAATSYKRMSGRQEPLRVVGSDRPGKSKRKKVTLLDRIEQRWRRRNEERGR